MGGYLSGRQRWRNRGNVEGVKVLDISQLNRMGCLEPGWKGRWEIASNTGASEWVNLCCSNELISVGFQTEDARGKQYETRQNIHIVRIRCRLGGTRPYFLCRGVVNDVVCGRRVAKLYRPVGGYILCRHCHRLSYASQNEHETDGAKRRAAKIRQRLGGYPGSTDSLPCKPKGMHWSTYEMLRSQYFEAEAVREEKLAQFEARFCGK